MDAFRVVLRVLLGVIVATALFMRLPGVLSGSSLSIGLVAGILIVFLDPIVSWNRSHGDRALIIAGILSMFVIGLSLTFSDMLARIVTLIVPGLIIGIALVRFDLNVRDRWIAFVLIGLVSGLMGALFYGFGVIGERIGDMLVRAGGDPLISRPPISEILPAVFFWCAAVAFSVRSSMRQVFVSGACALVFGSFIIVVSLLPLL